MTITAERPVTRTSAAPAQDQDSMALFLLVHSVLPAVALVLMAMLPVVITLALQGDL